MGEHSVERQRLADPLLVADTQLESQTDARGLLRLHGTETPDSPRALSVD